VVASLKTGIVAPPVVLRKLAAYRRQRQLDLSRQELERDRAHAVRARLARKPGITPTRSSFAPPASTSAWPAHTSPLSWEQISFSGNFSARAGRRDRSQAPPARSQRAAGRCVTGDVLCLSVCLFK
jgi:hypothetical protein